MSTLIDAGLEFVSIINNHLRRIDVIINLSLHAVFQSQQYSRYICELLICFRLSGFTIGFHYWVRLLLHAVLSDQLSSASPAAWRIHNEMDYLVQIVEICSPWRRVIQCRSCMASRRYHCNALLFVHGTCSNCWLPVHVVHHCHVL